MEYAKKHRRSSFLLLLLLVNISVWYAVSANNRRGLLTVAVLNVGQGDAIFIEAPNGNQVLVDGGPDKKVISELGKMMPLYDRSLDMIVVTNSDSDHYNGFFDVLKTYKVGKVLKSGALTDAPTYVNLENVIKVKGIPETVAERGMKIVLDEGVALYVLFPDRNVSNWATNDGSVVIKLVYGNTSFLLEGDAPQKIEKYLIEAEKTREEISSYGGLKGDVLKVGHHGSRTSTSPEYVEAVSPEYAVISDAKNNTYGFPHKETLDALEKNNVKILRTDVSGTIIFQSDGKSVVAK